MITSILWGWTLIAGIWWCIALFLLRTNWHRALKSSKPNLVKIEQQTIQDKPIALQNTPQITLSIFKPTPPLSHQSTSSLFIWKLALESFLQQMEPSHELLLGIFPEDLASWRPLLNEWKVRFPHATIQVIQDPPERCYLNPKIAWNKTLSPYARGTQWLWSDLDITVPSHYLKSILEEQSHSSQNYLTNAYLISTIPSPYGLFDTLFIHAEFLPGVLLLERFNRFKTAFGAGILFSARSVDDLPFWETLGNTLADDFQLAQLLGPGKLSQQFVTTSSQERTLWGALSHYFRWHKTIRWCDPLGYGGLVLLLPMIGVLVTTLFQPPLFYWIGIVWAIECLIGVIILYCTMNDFPWRALSLLPLWTWVRLFTWIAAWLPTSVQWGNTRWSKKTMP